MPPRSIVSDLVSRVASRERLYRSAFAADLTLLRKEHGRAPVAEAWKLLGARDNGGDQDEWDQLAHAKSVRKGIAKLMAERRAREEEF